MLLLNARFAAVVALAALLGASPAPSAGPAAASAGPNTAPPQGSGDGAYAALAKAYFDEAFRAAPAYATVTGVHD